MHKDAVLMIGYGAPEKLEDVCPFVEGVLRGKRVIPGRIEAIVNHYEQIGGGSPYNACVAQQAAALAARLNSQGYTLPVYVGMRNWHPFLRDVVRRMADDGVTRAITVIMAPYQGIHSWGRYEVALAIAMQQLGRRAIPSVSVDPWFQHQGFVTAQVARAEEELLKLSAERCRNAAYIFSVHSVPVDSNSSYERQAQTTAKLVATRLGIAKWVVAYQNRGGSSAEPWLGPDVLEEIKRLTAEGARDVVVIPIGFLCDNVEVLYDLDIVARKLCERLGSNYIRVKTVGTHPAFIKMLADLVLAKHNSSQFAE